jgi:predicted enzyme related to lactoylglutathione lyase
MVYHSERIVAILLFSVLLTTGCFRNRIVLPPISDNNTGKYTYGRFVWHDLLTDEVGKAKTFYESIFSWEFKGRGGNDAPYLTAYLENMPVAGIVKSDRLEPDMSESRWIGYISVPDVQKTAGLILSSQGIIFVSPLEMSRRGIVALAGDPWGGYFGLITSSDGDPNESGIIANGWYWNELFTPDPDTAAVFYGSVFNLKSETVKESGLNEHILLKYGNESSAGIQYMTRSSNQSLWIPYIRVADIKSTINRISASGGQILYQQKNAADRGSAAVITDPTGAVLGIQESP